jgi:hypothetical protein
VTYLVLIEVFRSCAILPPFIQSMPTLPSRQSSNPVVVIIDDSDTEEIPPAKKAARPSAKSVDIVSVAGSDDTVVEEYMVASENVSNAR